MPERDALFLSIHPQHARDIAMGLKRVELRRVKPRALVGDPAVIYSTSPVKAVIAFARVKFIETETPELIWRWHARSVGRVYQDDFNDYFHGARQAVAIGLHHVESLFHPIPLDALRDMWPNFQPPQSFRYMPMPELRVRAAIVAGNASQLNDRKRRIEKCYSV